MERDALLKRLCEGCPMPDLVPGSEPDPLSCLYELGQPEYRLRWREIGARYRKPDYQTADGTVVRILELPEREGACGLCPLASGCDRSCGGSMLYAVQTFRPRDYWIGYGQRCVAHCQWRFLECGPGEAGLRKILRTLETEHGWRSLQPETEGEPE